MTGLMPGHCQAFGLSGSQHLFKSFPLSFDGITVWSFAADITSILAETRSESSGDGYKVILIE